MTVFADYSRYYDLLYRDKDYRGEVDFVTRLIHEHAPVATKLLELGCGTGRHAELLATEGFQIHGIDQSEGMLADALRRKKTLPREVADRLDFSMGDARDVRLEQKFDMVVSLFHVMSYMTTNEDLSRAFATAREHLNPGGLFLFDFWYGPAVLTDPPVVRIKRLADEQLAITRIAEPVLYANENCVEVNYEIQVRDKGTGQVNVLHESHRMRYLFLPEIRNYLYSHGMEPVFSCEWLSGAEPGVSTWNVVVGGRVVAS